MNKFILLLHFAELFWNRGLFFSLTHASINLPPRNRLLSPSLRLSSPREAPVWTSVQLKMSRLVVSAPHGEEELNTADLWAVTGLQSLLFPPVFANAATSYPVFSGIFLPLLASFQAACAPAICPTALCGWQWGAGLQRLTVQDFTSTPLLDPSGSEVVSCRRPSEGLSGAWTHWFIRVFLSPRCGVFVVHGFCFNVNLL